MLFWIIAALMTVLALALVLAPLMRRPTLAQESEPVEVALYRSQTAAIADEESAGRIQSEDAETTRIEIKRRMLAASRQRKGRMSDLGVPSPKTYRRAAVLIGGLVPLIAMGVYLAGGRPDLPDRPFAERAAERTAAGVPTGDEMALVQRLATRMAQHPEDPQGWILLARAYVRQARYDEAIEAYQKANARKPGDAEILSALGEALVLQSGGEITEDARANFEAAVKVAPDTTRSRYFIALGDAQAGDYAGAIAGWSALLSDAPKDAPWRSLVEAQLEQAQDARSQMEAELGPGIADRAAKMSPHERQIMIRGMVDGLAARLAAAPNDLAGWLRLARSYAVLGEPDKAGAALQQAAEHFKGDAAALTEIAKARDGLPLGATGIAAPAAIR